MRRCDAWMRDWGPVGACAGVVGWVLVWLGLTACGLVVEPIDADVDVDFDIGDPSAPGPVYLAHESADAALAIWKVQQAWVEGEGGRYEPVCHAEGFRLPNTEVRDLEIVRIEFEDVTRAPETRFYALVPTPGREALVVLRMSDGFIIAWVDLPFTPKAFDISPSTRHAYVAAADGPEVARIDLVTNTVEATSAPTSGGVAVLQHPIDVRVRTGSAGQDELWISDAGPGGVVILDGSLSYLASVALEPGTTPRMDFDSDRSHAYLVTDGTPSELWEIDATTRDATPLATLSNARTISVEASGFAPGFTALFGASFSAFSLRFGFVDRERSFPLGLEPVSQLHTADPAGAGSDSFAALHDAAGNGSVACPDVDAQASTTARPSAFARFRSITGFPNPPLATSIVVNTAPVPLSFHVDAVEYFGSASFDWVPGTLHELRAPLLQTSEDARYRFSTWGDDVAEATRSVIAPAEATTYTAIYSAEYQLTVNTTLGGTFDVMPDSPDESGYYPAGTSVTVTATPDAGYTATLAGFDSINGLSGVVQMNSARTVTVTFTPVAGTTATFTTSGVFRCTPGEQLVGCGTSLLRARAVLLTFVPASRTETPDPSAPTVLGDVIIGCLGGAVADCPAANFNTLGVTLDITINQTSPFAASGPIGGNGVMTGQLAGPFSSAMVAWLPASSFVDLGQAGVTLRYEVFPLSFALPPPVLGTCPAGCPLPTPASVVTITGTVRVLPGS